MSVNHHVLQIDSSIKGVRDAVTYGYNKNSLEIHLILLYIGMHPKISLIIGTWSNNVSVIGLSYK